MIDVTIAFLFAILRFKIVRFAPEVEASAMPKEADFRGVGGHRVGPSEHGAASGRLKHGTGEDASWIGRHGRGLPPYAFGGWLPMITKDLPQLTGLKLDNQIPMVYNLSYRIKPQKIGRWR